MAGPRAAGAAGGKAARGGAWPAGWEREAWAWKARAPAKTVRRALARVLEHPAASGFRRRVPPGEQARYAARVRVAVDLGAVRRRVESPAPGEGELSLLELEWMLAVMVANRLATVPQGSRERDQALEFKAHVTSVLALAQRECRGLVYKPPREARGGRGAAAAGGAAAAVTEAGSKRERPPAPEKKAGGGGSKPGGDGALKQEGGEEGEEAAEPPRKSARGGGAGPGAGARGGRGGAAGARTARVRGARARKGGSGAAGAEAGGPGSAGGAEPGSSHGTRRPTTPRTAERWAKMSIKKRWLEQARRDGPLKSPP